MSESNDNNDDEIMPKLGTLDTTPFQLFTFASFFFQGLNFLITFFGVEIFFCSVRAGSKREKKLISSLASYL